MLTPENLTILGDVIHAVPFAAVDLPYLSAFKIQLEKKEKLEFLSAKSLRLQFRLNALPCQFWSEVFNRECGSAGAYLDQDVLIFRSAENELVCRLEEIMRLIESVNQHCAVEWTRLRPLVEAEDAKRQHLHHAGDSAMEASKPS